jgi:exo-1,4-beta-D-glucosaminidase
VNYCKKGFVFKITLTLIVLFVLFQCNGKVNRISSADIKTITLTDGWELFSSANCQVTGADISLSGFHAKSSISITLPKTVLGALVDSGIYKDVFKGKNLKKIDREQFKNSWWYRKEFNLTNTKQSHTKLIFEGINYRADIWLNGKKIAGSKKTAGSFRIYGFQIDSFLLEGKNILAVEVFPPADTELSIGFVDWNPQPQDRSMGLFREVKLKRTGLISVDRVFVKSRLFEDLKMASLTISAELTNFSDREVKTEIKMDLAGFQIDKIVQLKGNESRKVEFLPGEFEFLKIKHPRLWWPNNLGEPNLYELKVSALINEKISDTSKLRFGIRKIEDYFNQQGHRGYKVNGRKVLIKSAGWVDDIFLREDYHNLSAQLNYVKSMNLNSIRLEGFFGSSQKLFNLADELGIMVMIGWSCHWEWKDYCSREDDDMYMSISTEEDIDHFSKSYRDQVIWLRNHPSIFVWVFGSDKLLRPVLERKIVSYIEEYDSTRPVLGSCKYKEFGKEKFNISEVTGPSLVKMKGPYGYVTPNYWYLDTEAGGAYGFNTETGPGPQIPPLESIKKMIPAKDLWPVENNEMWRYHSGRNEFQTLKRYLNAFNQRYGRSNSIEEFAFNSQISNYEAMRAMFEAFVVNRPLATGVVQWMLNSAWPELFWQLYDYYLMPNGAFYGAKKGCQPLNIVYNYKDNDIYLSNEYLKAKNDLSVQIKVFNLKSKPVLNKKIVVSINPNSLKKIFNLPELKSVGKVYFIDLRISDKLGNKLASNFYWLSAKKDIIDFKNAKWFIAPNKSYADFTGLSELPEVSLDIEYEFKKAESRTTFNVSIKNRSEFISFFNEIQIKGENSGLAILPIFIEDNYFSILPGENKTIKGYFFNRDLAGDDRPEFFISGYNLKVKLD